jgi:hypothetical protein
VSETFQPSTATASGFVVVESPPAGARIALPGLPVTAFVAPAPRGPAHVPVAVRSVAAYRQRFGSPAERSRLEWALEQFFDNGGDTAIVVRVPRSRSAATVALPGPGGALALRAVNPGPREYLRAAVDYDRIDPDDLWRFNLTVQRIRRRRTRWWRSRRSTRASASIPTTRPSSAPCCASRRWCGRSMNPRRFARAPRRPVVPAPPAAT